MAKLTAVASAEVEKEYAAGEGVAKIKAEEGQTVEQQKSADVGRKLREGATKHKESLVMKFGKSSGTQLKVTARSVTHNTNDALAPTVAV